MQFVYIDFKCSVCYFIRQFSYFESTITLICREAKELSDSWIYSFYIVVINELRVYIIKSNNIVFV